MNSSVFNLRTQGRRGVSEWHTGRGPTPTPRAIPAGDRTKALDWLGEANQGTGRKIKRNAFLITFPDHLII